MYAYLTMIKGARPGANFSLAREKENRIGRGIDCHVVLSDPLCSREHAVLFQDGDGWWLRDAGSRNGTYVNGQRADEARLLDGSLVRVGSTEFTFRETAEHPNDGSLTQTIIRDRSLGTEQTLSPDTGRPEVEYPAIILRDLFELSLTLLGGIDPDAAVAATLDLLKRRIHVSFLAFLWVGDDGRLKPQQVVPPESARDVHISDYLTELVSRRQKAVWVADQSSRAGTEALKHYADAMCIPLVSEEKVLGALHLYRELNSFEQNDFDLACEAARLLGITLARTRAQATLAQDNRRLKEKFGGFDELIGESRPMRELKNKIGRVAQAAGCVLIRGESGSGKELVARAIHRASPRADRPLLAVNCAAIARDLMESQLFGHKRGAFTGADADHIGWFGQADSGTLFLDEVGEMTLEGQAKLLRILDGHPFLPVGGVKEVSTDVRVIAATNRDLSDFVREGRFREDLYYRLSVFELYVPPLRDRGEDIGRLIDYFLDHFKRQHGRPQLQLSTASRAKLQSYIWPGNVRQLRNVLDSVVVMADGDTIEPHELGLRDTGSSDFETLRLDLWERRLIREALERTGNNVPEAAKLLGIGRATLYRKIDDVKGTG